MAKTVRYTMSVNTWLTDGLKIPISKKVFDQQIMHYKKLIEENHTSYREKIEELKERNPKYWNYSDIENCLNDIGIKTDDGDKYTVTTYTVIDGDTFIFFREEKCKPGYCFKTKKL